MKRTLLFITLSAAVISHAIAQPVVGKATKILPKVTAGIKLGANMQSLSGDAWKSNYNAGIVGGGFIGVTKGKIGVQGEILVKSAKFDPKVSSSGSSVSVNTMQLDIPVLFEYKLVNRLWLQVGPQFSSIISAKQNSTDVKKSFNTTDFAAVAGLQVILPMHLVAGARYVLGMTNINKESVTGANQAWNQRSIQVYVGFRFL